MEPDGWILDVAAYAINTACLQCAPRKRRTSAESTKDEVGLVLDVVERGRPTAVQFEQEQPMKRDAAE